MLKRVLLMLASVLEAILDALDERDSQRAGIARQDLPYFNL